MSPQHRACPYNAAQPWEVTDMPSEFVAMAPSTDKGSHEFAMFVEEWQSEHGLKADGMLGPRTLAAIQREYERDHVEAPRTLAIGGGTRSVQFEVVHGQPFKARDRGKLPTRIDIHESVTNDPNIFANDDTTERILRRRGLGVHIMVGPDGSIVQHNDLVDDMVAHVGRYNRASIGIEVVGPYYKSHPPFWNKVISAPWAHKGKYALPPQVQLEATWSVVEAIFNLSNFDGAPLDVPILHGGAYPDPDHPNVTRVCMGRLPKRFASRNQGLFAHGYTGHADGYFPVLYCYFRMMSVTPDVSYARSVALATVEAHRTARKYVSVDLR